MNIKYIVYNPAGNITALVIGDEYSLEERRLINNIIIEKEPTVEQVGFLSQKNIKLTMAGGEFCGNASRCAALYYLREKENIKLEITNQIIKAGIDENKNIWCEIPIEQYQIIKLNENIYKVILEGITIIVVKNITDYKNLKEKAKSIIEYYSVDDKAVGVMFVKKDEYLEMYPIVWVKDVNTFFFENACGSGTISVTMLETILSQKSNNYFVKQPSGEFLETSITINNNKIIKAILKGKIKTDNKIRELSLDSLQ